LIHESHPLLDLFSLIVILMAAVNYGLAGAIGTDLIAKIDPLPPTFAVVVGLCGVWQALRQH
jgi:uncharacterized membrane protein YuzA (DUF378 family)